VLLLLKSSTSIVLSIASPRLATTQNPSHAAGFSLQSLPQAQLTNRALHQR